MQLAAVNGIQLNTQNIISEKNNSDLIPGIFYIRHSRHLLVVLTILPPFSVDGYIGYGLCNVVKMIEWIFLAGERAE
jgi:hypothetical protein